jgi:microsomal dipeptidase-like Zn-dependent dipeptidase
MAVIDLHLHPAMNVGMPFVFRGRPTEEPAPARTETSLLENQLSLKDFRAGDIRLIAATLYAVPVVSQLRGGYLAELRRQIRAVKEWIRTQGLSLVNSPDEAERICREPSHSLGVVLAVEGTHGIVTEEAVETLYEDGVRLLTISHLVDSPWSGAADVRYWPFSEGNPHGEAITRRNPLGLTKLGARLLKTAVRRGMLVDLTHASDQAFRDVVELFPELPLLFTHQCVRDVTPNERAISSDQLRHLAATGGMTGLFFSSQFMGPGIEDLVEHARAIARDAGPGALALGSDFNGLTPRVKGVANSEGYAAVLDALEKEGLKAVRTSAESFTELWRRFERESRRS